MLDVCIYALLCGAVDHCGCDISAQDPVLGIILKVTSAERIAVGIHRRTIPSVDIAVRILCTDSASHLVRQICIP